VRKALPVAGVLALSALVCADQLAPSHGMLFGFSLEVADIHLSFEAKAGDVERK
jgi:hypothetical protein